MPEISSDIIIGHDKLSKKKQFFWFLDNLLLSELRLASPLSWELEKEKKNLGVELIFYSKRKCYERDNGNYFSGKAGNEVEEANKGHRVGKC